MLFNNYFLVFQNKVYFKNGVLFIKKNKKDIKDGSGLF